MGHVVIGTSVCLRFCFLLTLTGLVIIWTSGMCVSVSRAFGTNRNHVGLYWKCSAGRGWRRRGEGEGEERFVKVSEPCQRGGKIKTAKIASAETLIIP